MGSYTYVSVPACTLLHIFNINFVAVATYVFLESMLTITHNYWYIAAVCRVCMCITKGTSFIGPPSSPTFIGYDHIDNSATSM